MSFWRKIILNVTMADGKTQTRHCIVKIELEFWTQNPQLRRTKTKILGCSMMIRAVESASLKVGKSLKIGKKQIKEDKNQIKSENSDLI